MALVKTLIFAGIIAALSPGISNAQDAKNQGYLVDSYGNSITTSSNTALCWRDSEWTPARSVEPCDPVARKAEAPAPELADATPPSPQPALAPQKMLSQKITFSADALFDFNKAALKPEGKASLDKLAHELADAQYDVITVTGLTDRIGGNQYNQKLSERRANAVKDYLVSRDIPKTRIHAEGKGETLPVTKLGDCTGPTSRKLIACLQPDRRVDVDVTGTRNITTSSR
jgi:OmpA-OmpF porin, OOP family